MPENNSRRYVPIGREKLIRHDNELIHSLASERMGQKPHTSPELAERMKRLTPEQFKQLKKAARAQLESNTNPDKPNTNIREKGKVIRKTVLSGELALGELTPSQRAAVAIANLHDNAITTIQRIEDFIRSKQVLRDS